MHEFTYLSFLFSPIGASIVLSLLFTLIYLMWYARNLVRSALGIIEETTGGERPLARAVQNLAYGGLFLILFGLCWL